MDRLRNFLALLRGQLWPLPLLFTLAAVALAFVLLCLSSLVTLVVPLLLGRFAEVLLAVDDPWQAAEVLMLVVLCVLVQSVVSYFAAVRVGSIG